MKLPSDLKRAPSAADVGRDWLYRQSVRKPWQRVELLEAAGEKPKRVRIQHTDTHEGGRAEWVPATRLVTPWDTSREYLASLDAWAGLLGLAPGTAITDLLTRIVADYLPAQVADVERTGSAGALTVHNLGALSDMSGLGELALTSHPSSIRVDGGWILPWPTAEGIVTALIARSPGPAMAYLQGLTVDRQSFDRLIEEEGDRWWMRDNAPLSARGPGRWHEMGSEQIRQLREWLDGPHPTLAQSYLELRSLHAEMAAALREAIPRVRMGRSQTADRIADRMQELLERPTPFLDVRGLTSEPYRTDVL